MRAQGVSRFGSGLRLSSWLSDVCLPAMSKYDRDKALVSLPFFIRELISSWGL